MLKNKESEGVFQLESDLFKGLLDAVQASDENDICALLALGRPGPLGAGMHKRYAERKLGNEEPLPQLRGTDNITQDTYNTIIYQEQCMLIAKQVAGFNDSQSDSIMRKALAKKKKDKMEIARRLLIYGKLNENPPADYDDSNKNQPLYDPKGKYGTPVLGGINNGYTEKELIEFWEKLKGYASYLFNKSHSASYSVITLCTAYLKTYYGPQFFAALLSMDNSAKKIDIYKKVLDKMHVKISLPDINKSVKDFKYDKESNSIIYGLSAIKGLGDAVINAIIENREYVNLEDLMNKIPKKILNKRALTALVKAGAFDNEEPNRYKMLNNLYDLRKDKDERLDVTAYTEKSCMAYEKEILGTYITYTPYWDKVQNYQKIVHNFIFCKAKIIMDRKGRNMAFITISDGSNEIDGVMFALSYNKYSHTIKNLINKNSNETQRVQIKGKKDDNNHLIIDEIKETIA